MTFDFSPTPFFYIFIGFVVGFLAGWASGFFDARNRTAKKIQSAEANAEIAIKDAEKKIAEANRKLAEIPAPQVMVQDDPGLLRLKNERGYYALEIDGAPIRGALASDGKKRLIELLTVIRPYLEGGLPAQAPASTPMSAAPAPRPAPVMSAPVARPTATLPTTPEAPAADAPPKTLVNPDDKKEMAKLGMIAQIDAVLQWRLVSSAFAKRGIRVTESPEGGVRVEVGLEKFEAVDDVTDPEIKAFIKNAIAEWEKKFTPGL
jgi:hypothetical protein